MELQTLVGVFFFVVALTMTIHSWREYLGSRRVREGFVTSDDVLSASTMSAIAKAREPKPQGKDADAAYQTLLRFIRDDYATGVKFVIDFRNRFFGEHVQLREDLDVRRLLDNYQSPLQRV